MTKDEIQKVTLGTNEALRVTADGEFIWHPEADAMIEEGDFTSSPAMRHILRALRKALAAPDLQADLVKANSQAEHFEREWYLRGDELEATNRQVEILSDALAESRREVAALKAVPEPVRLQCVHCGTVYADGVPPAVPAPVQEPVAWKWHQAPAKTSWGHDMVVADLAIDKGNTVSVYCERDQTAKVEAMFTPPAAKRQWVDLTPQDLNEIFKVANTGEGAVYLALEKVKEKNT